MNLGELLRVFAGGQGPQRPKTGRKRRAKKAASQRRRRQRQAKLYARQNPMQRAA